MPPAERDLVELVSALPDEPAAGRALARVRDWPAFVDDAVAHGLAGVLLDVAQGAPDASLRLLETAVAIERMRQDALREALALALEALDAAKIRAAVLKGLVLGERLYGRPGVRPTTDIDLLTADADCEAAVEALGRAGWHWAASPSERYSRRHHHHLHLEARDRPTVELHFRAVVGFGAAVPSEDFLARSVPYTSVAGPTRVLAPEDELLYLAVHAAGHMLTRLGWLYDIKLLARSHPELSWAEVVRRARAYGVERAASFVLDAARDIGAPIPAEATRPVGARARAAERSLGWARGPRPLSVVGSLAFSALLSDSGQASVRYVLHHTQRAAKRRAQRYLPQLFPAEWSG